MENKQSLYRISEEHRAIMHEIEMNEGEITPEIADRMDSVVMSLEAKAESYCFVIKQFDDTEEIIAREIERLKALKAKAARNSDMLKQRLLNIMTDMDMRQIKTPIITISVRSTPSVSIDHEDMLPDTVLRVKTITEPDKKMIKSLLDSGLGVPGASIKFTNSLNIR